MPVIHSVPPSSSTGPCWLVFWTLIVGMFPDTTLCVSGGQDRAKTDLPSVLFVSKELFKSDVPIFSKGHLLFIYYIKSWFYSPLAFLLLLPISNSYTVKSTVRNKKSEGNSLNICQLIHSLLFFSFPFSPFSNIYSWHQITIVDFLFLYKICNEAPHHYY